MTDELLVITPELTPGAGGVGDYTLRLIENLPDREKIRLRVPPGDRKEFPMDVHKVLVQYSAYGFDRLGYPRQLIRALIDWKSRSQGRLVIMFHEIWTFWPMTNRNFFVQMLHRRGIKHLLSHADMVFTSTASQAAYLRTLSASVPIHVLPVGSNISRKFSGSRPRHAGQAIIFGRQQARLRSLKKMRASLNALATAGQVTGIVTVGANSDPEGHTEATISEMLSTASFGIFGQDELSYGKSGTFMAYATHELNILADFADSSGPEPVCWLVAPGELLNGMSQSELKERAERLRDWQQRTASWELIGATIAQALELGATERLQVQTARQ
jgi:hypothetical protein